MRNTSVESELFFEEPRPQFLAYSRKGSKFFVSFSAGDTKSRSTTSKDKQSIGILFLLPKPKTRFSFSLANIFL